MTFWLTQIFNGISYGAIVFLLAMGLSLIFGVMKVINVTHGTYFLVGAYFGLTTLKMTGNFFLAILIGGIASHHGHCDRRVFLRRLRGTTWARL